MRKFIFTLLLIIPGLFALAQVETYTCLKATGNNVPKIDGVIDEIWNNVEVAHLLKVPDNNQITEPNPTADDYKADIQFLWTDEGLYLVFTIVDDNLVIVDDYYTDNEIAADEWWYDDNINLLFSKDLYNNTFTQWEFAWQPTVWREEKLSSDLWANPAVIDSSLVVSDWEVDGTTYKLESFISWEAFGDGTITPSSGDVIQCEARARDDDDDGSWETMFQWSTTNYGVESNGEGMGEVTLSATEVVNVTGVKASSIESFTLYPNPVNDIAELHFNMKSDNNVTIDIYDVCGKKVRTSLNEYRPQGAQSIMLNVEGLSKGNYFVRVNTGDENSVLKLMKL